MNCLLCHTHSISNENDAFLCSHCGLVFKNPESHLNAEEDQKRYSCHQNNEFDLGYIDFLNRLVRPLADFLPAHFSALDFGCGPGPVLDSLLRELGGIVENYDPIFAPNGDLLKQDFDVVTSTEVVEHFKNPASDWSQLIGRVRPGGVLGIMTQFFGPGVDYKVWWYKNDPTHVVFYQEKTFQFIADKFKLDILLNDKNSVIIFKKK
ncbi:MAG: class I SAM-dependent methyltransferase [Bacteriovorax sp.]|jgi:SAM-dependent methyltransferase